MVMKPYKHQAEEAPAIEKVLKEHFIAYIAWEERTGKSLTALLVAESCDINAVLIVTTKKALTGWFELLEQFDHKLNYTVVNYHQAHKQNKHDLVILDESHNYISAFPKPGKIWKELKSLCKNVPIMYLSATPHGQGEQMLYHQFALSSWSPWTKYPNFYSWFKTFGKPYQIELHGRRINQYDKCDGEFVLGCVDHLFNTKTRKELGFKQEPVDKIHYIELAEDTRTVYNELLKHNIIELNAGTLVCDTTSKLRYSLHMLEGGTAKINNTRLILANDEKLQYMLKTFGDYPGLVIMYNYIKEREKIEMYFKEALILQATSYAEGVDLSMYDELVIYSQDFRTSKHTQRRARQANMKREDPIVVHFLLVKKGISEQVYKTVSINKKNYVDSVFERSAV